MGKNKSGSTPTSDLKTVTSEGNKCVSHVDLVTLSTEFMRIHAILRIIQEYKVATAAVLQKPTKQVVR